MEVNSGLHLSVQGIPLTGIGDLQLGGLLQPLTVADGGYNRDNKSLWVSGFLDGKSPLFVSLDSGCRIRTLGLYPKVYASVSVNGLEIVGLGIEVLSRFVNVGLRVFNAWDMYSIPDWNLSFQLDAEDFIESATISLEEMDWPEWNGTI
jgi:hypothetical protein